MNVSEVSSSLFPRREFLRVGSASLVASIVGCAQTPKENLVPRERLEKQISEMRMNFNGQERNVPRDVKIEGPNKDGNFTLESNHLRRVTPSKIEFNERGVLLTAEIIIKPEGDLVSMILSGNGLEKGDICTLRIKGNIIFIEKK